MASTKKTVSAPKAETKATAFPVNPLAAFATLSELQKAALTKAPTKAKQKTAKDQAKAIVADVTKSAPVITPVIVAPTVKPVISAPIKSLCLVNYAICDYARPSAGRTLFAFTAAWLHMFNLLNGATVAHGTLKAVCGSTAVTYHTKQGNFEVNAKGLQLSAKGLNFFNARKTENKFDEKVKEAFIGIMTTGEIDNALVKSKSALIKLCA